MMTIALRVAYLCLLAIGLADIAQAQTVTLTAPTNGSTSAVGTPINLAASVTGGSVTRVRFYQNGNLIGLGDNSSPYTETFTPSTAGNYEFKAEGIKLGNTFQSNTVTVTVTGGSNPPPGGQVTRSYVYDANERLCKTIDPEAGATVIDYDAAGNISWTASGLNLPSTVNCDRTDSTVAAAKVIRTYDELNRLKTVVTPGNAADVTTTYTPDGLVASLVATNGAAGAYPVTTTYSYNKRRLLVSETSAQPTYTYTLGYAYSANGHLSALTYPDTQVVTYAPDALGRATEIKAGTQVYASGIGYYANGAISGFTYGNGVVHTMTQNARLLPTRSVDVKSGTTVLDDTYAFDANGNVDYITDALPASATNRSRDLGYDNLDRLIVADAPNQWGTATYSYDAIDNLTSADQGTRQYRYTYDANNRLAEIKTPAGTSVWTLGYDAGGNVTRKGTQDFVFDPSNRMTTAELLDGSGVQAYRYDGTGRRVQTTDPGGAETFWMYSQSGQVLYTTEARRSRNLAYIYLGNTQVATRAVAFGTGVVTLRYQHTDALGSPVAETDPAGAVLQRTSYAPYGEVYGPTPTDGTGYTGHVMDAGTGLTYMQQRYYDPSLGSFMSVDPAEAQKSPISMFNRYRYANSNPYKLIDPDGRTCTSVDGAFNCVVDAFVDKNGQSIQRSDLSKSQLKRVERFERSYSTAVNKLMANPTRAANLTLPSGKSATTTAGEVGQALIGRTFEVNSKLAQNGMATGNNITYIGSGALNGTGTLVGVTPKSSDAHRMITITHEGMHGDGAPSTNGLRGSMPFGPWNQDHQEAFNHAAETLLSPPKWVMP